MGLSHMSTHTQALLQGTMFQPRDTSGRVAQEQGRRLWKWFTVGSSPGQRDSLLLLGSWFPPAPQLPSLSKFAGPTPPPTCWRPGLVPPSHFSS
jgi:hypothetical protein